MAYKTLIFGVDDMFKELQPYYAHEVQRGNLEIIAFAILEKDRINLVIADEKSTEEVNYLLNFELAIISSRNDFYNRMKLLEAQGVPRNRIIDGRVFQVPNLDFLRLLKEDVAYGFIGGNSFQAASYTIYPRIYRFATNKSIFKLGRKSYIGKSTIEGHHCAISVGNFSALSWNITFEALPDNDHHYENISSYGYCHLDWYTGDDFIKSQSELCKINIGSDVWIGRGCFLKCTKLNKPLIIGDGAIIATDSVVVKNVPPYAIVGGNPAKIIKFRFSEDVIESLLRIKWWDWSLDKIHDNFKYFNNIDKFISLHDK